MWIVDGDHLFRHPDAELFLERQNPNQRMLLRDAELRHVQLRHHVVNIQHNPGPQKFRDEPYQHEQIRHRMHVDNVVPFFPEKPQQFQRGRAQKSQVREPVAQAASPAVAQLLHAKDPDALHCLERGPVLFAKRDEIDLVSSASQCLRLPPRAGIGEVVRICDHTDFLHQSREPFLFLETVSLKLLQ